MTAAKVSNKSFRRSDPRASVGRDLDRLNNRERGEDTFWRSLSVIGAVGWPIVTATVGGALVGRWLHMHWNTGFGLTAVLVAAGAIVGMIVVWRLIEPRPK